MISTDISEILNQSRSMISLIFHQLQYLNNQIHMNQQISQEYFIQKFSSLHLSETDDDTSRSESPVLDSRLMEFVGGLPAHIKIKLENFKPSQNFQLSKQNDGSIYFGMMEDSLKHGIGIQLWPKIGNLLKGTWQNDLLEGVCTMYYSNGDMQLQQSYSSFEAQFSQGKTVGFGMFKSEKKVVKGIWINNQLQGEGQEMKSDGTTYQGQFWDGRKQGRGIQMFSDGCKQNSLINLYDIQDSFKIINLKEMDYLHGVTAVITKANFIEDQLEDLGITIIIMGFNQWGSLLVLRNQKIRAARVESQLKSTNHIIFELIQLNIANRKDTHSLT
ncbi:unnamed protein product (macronuclear) [Paramecium tetraurelia]|uniref:MORN repeat protein n=1 Tax=Paramecium tetraurelia TaxID=5888 RepID=A0DV06_PARTE|nr:uncharacterized protein GSPATT00020535001 [Paramecium tetraurelia]CAK86873.1 unnamed protein product [Paramecium tetraurelia]|eukprot:XP_001454270.1 hypothetical protein (macronuclear) [Paramecium tetraurelia strain d4-2]